MGMNTLHNINPTAILTETLADLMCMSSEMPENGMFEQNEYECEKERELPPFFRQRTRSRLWAKTRCR